MRMVHRIRLMMLACLAMTAASSGQSGVTISVDQFGPGNSFRAGGMTAVRVQLTSNLAAPTPVWVQWQVPNCDGDIGEYGRSLGALTPNSPSYLWLYAPLSPETSMQTVWTVRVFEERDGVRRSEVGGARISAGAATRQVDISASMIAVIGDKRMGLDDYTNTGSTRLMRPVGAHEDTAVVFGIKPTELPDRWFGLFPAFDAIAWAGDAAPPQDLGADQAEALRQYVARGGHLIISLPMAGNIWGLGAIGQTQIEDLLPCRTAGIAPRKDDAVPLADLLPTLSKFEKVTSLVGTRKPPEFSIRVFKDLGGTFNVIDNHYEPLVALNDGRVIAIQRPYGFGRITVIGVDLADGRLASLDLPQGDPFWNRILGRRSDTPSATEIVDTEKADRLNKAYTTHDNNLGSGPLITGKINLPGTAATGLLLAFVLFAAYWLLAGPLGFGLLKYYGQIKHAWLVFAGCAAVFTGLAWGSVGLMPRPLQVSHVTFLDHIARAPGDTRTDEPQLQRAVSYFSVHLPHYGSTPISIASLPDQRDVLMSWTPPGVNPQFFPNSDRYRIDVGHNAASCSLPSRSTTTQLCAYWMGGLDPNWGGMLRIDPNNPIAVDVDAAGNESIRGSIINELPGTLTNVKIFWVKNNRIGRHTYDQGSENAWINSLRSGEQLNTGAFLAQGALDVGKALDLSEIGKKGAAAGLKKNIDDRYVKPFESRDFTAAASVGVNDNERPAFFEMLSIFQQLTPPSYLRSPGSNNGYEDTVSFRRELGRELDLSAWFTRPCVIIIGYLEQSKCPVPLRLNNESEPPESSGLTVVRWIYPLPLEEKVAFRDAFPEKEQ